VARVSLGQHSRQRRGGAELCGDVELNFAPGAGCARRAPYVLRTCAPSPTFPPTSSCPPTFTFSGSCATAVRFLPLWSFSVGLFAFSDRRRHSRSSALDHSQRAKTLMKS
jgi:hypothetical protein